MPKTLGENIKEIRNKRNLTQGMLAEYLGVSDKTVSSWENNRTEPNMGNIESMAKALNVDKGEIIDGEQYQPAKRDRTNPLLKTFVQICGEKPALLQLLPYLVELQAKDIEKVIQAINQIQYGNDEQS